jgi:ABC-type nitrate/sulfonate/bicarbonate transport system permease component
MITKQENLKRWSVVIAMVVFLAAWEGLVRLLSLPAFILPAPVQVGERFLRAASDGTLLRHTAATLLEVMAGLASGVFFATLLGYLLAKIGCEPAPMLLGFREMMVTHGVAGVAK